MERDLIVQLNGFGELVALAADGVGGEAGAAGENAGDLAHAVGAVVEVDDDVVVFYRTNGNGADRIAFTFGAGERRDELVGDAVVVELFDPFDGVCVAAAFGMTCDQSVEGLFLLFPAKVAVHGVVAAAHTGNLSHARFAKGLLKLLEIAEAAGRQGIAPVHESVDEDVGELALRGHADESVEMALVRVNSAVREQADEVKRSSLLRSEVVGANQRWVGVKRAVEDGGVDARHVHPHDAACAEVEMAYFGVPHLPVGEPDKMFAGAEQRVGIVAKERVVGGLAGLSDGVAVGLGAIAPAVEDSENDGFGHARSGYQDSPIQSQWLRWDSHYLRGRGVS